MKTIPIRNNADPYNTKMVLDLMLKQSPYKAITLDNMRLRDKMFNKLEIAQDSIILEDDEWQILSDAVKTFPWSVYNKDLLQVLEDIEGATEC